MPIIRPFDPNKPLKPRLGDRVEQFLKPVAKLLKLPCLNPDGALKPDSGCAKRRDWLNELGSS